MLLSFVKGCHCVNLDRLFVRLQDRKFELFKYMIASIFRWLAS